jgi:hypothetical protein
VTTARHYADPCGIARALNVVGDRWALLIVRELIFGPKRFVQLRHSLPEYSELVADAIGGHGNVVLVAQSLGGFTAPLAAAKVLVDSMVFVNAMIPCPGETPGEWWDNTGWAHARIAAARQGGYGTEVDLAVYFLHDVPPEVAAAGEPYQRPEAGAAFGSVCDFTAWPPIPIRAVAGADDRFFPAGFQQALARDRFGVKADVLPGGHLIALAQPAGLASYLLGA